MFLALSLCVVFVLCGPLRFTLFPSPESRVPSPESRVPSPGFTASSLSGLTLIYCGKAEIGQIFRSFSLKGPAIRLKRAKNLPQTGFPSLRSVKPDRLLESAYVPNPDPHCARWRVAQVLLFRPGPRAARSAGVCGGRSRVGGYAGRGRVVAVGATRSEEHTSDLQSLMRISY